MSRLIDADAFETELLKLLLDGDDKIKSVADVAPLISNAPTVDAVRVVRCKDCKRHEDEEPGMVYCPLQIGGWRHENWFCAAGERKEE